MKYLASPLVSVFFIFGMLLVDANADVNINIGVSAPPLVYASPPDVVVVPSGPSEVYLVPDTPGVYFYGGYWYRFYEDRWFRATVYNGPWAYVSTSLVPAVVVYIPPDYVRHLPRGYHRIHYNDFHRHWRTWQRDRYWNRYNWYRHQTREIEKRRHTQHYKPPKGHKPPPKNYGPPKGQQPPKGGYGSPHNRGAEPPKQGYGPPQSGKHNPSVQGRGAKPGTPYNTLIEKGQKSKSKGQKSKGKQEQNGKKGEKHEQR